MASRAKRIEAMRRNPRGVRPQDLEAALLSVGFEKREGKGDHRRYTKGNKAITLDFGRNPVLAIYVKQALVLIEGEE